MRRFPPTLIAVIAVALAATTARAEDAPSTNPTGNVKLGYVQTGGNTEVLTLLASDKIEYKTGKWLLAQQAEAVYGQDHHIENAGRYMAEVRGDYGLTPRLAAYGLVGWRRNVFSGIARRMDQSVGLLFHAITPSPQQLDFEAGAGLVQRETTEPKEEDFSTGRLAALYKYFFSEKAYIEASGNWVVNLDDTDDSDSEGRVSLVAPIAGGISLNLGYTTLYRTRPVAGFEKLDWTTSAGLQYSF